MSAVLAIIASVALAAHAGDHLPRLPDSPRNRAVGIATASADGSDVQQVTIFSAFDHHPGWRHTR